MTRPRRTIVYFSPRCSTPSSRSAKRLDASVAVTSIIASDYLMLDRVATRLVAHSARYGAASQPQGEERRRWVFGGKFGHVGIDRVVDIGCEVFVAVGINEVWQANTSDQNSSMKLPGLSVAVVPA